MIIEIISLLLALLIYSIGALYLKKELKLQDFLIIFISTTYIANCLLDLFDTLSSHQDLKFVKYILIGMIVIIWVSFEKIKHIIKED